MNFFKYESLGNDFIIFENEQQFTPEQIRALCNRNFGIGADGVLVVSTIQDKIKAEIFNSDGSTPEVCYNGLRCVADFVHKKTDKNKFTILMGKKEIACVVEEFGIVTNVGVGSFLGQETIFTFIGDVINVGNPHFVIFEKIELDWLKQNGKLIESHIKFPNKINTEFVWKIAPAKYETLVYERGCGITLACSSGAAAITIALLKRKEIKPDEKISISMLGGSLNSWISHNNEIFLEAGANMVFEGQIFLKRRKSE